MVGHLSKSLVADRELLLAAPSAEKSVASLWAARLAADPHRPLLRMAGDIYDAAAIERLASGVSGSLSDAGVAPGEIVGQLSATSLESVVEYVACSRMGIPLCPLNTSFRGHLLRYVLEDVHCKVLFCSAEFVERVVEVSDSLPWLELIVVHDLDPSWSAADSGPLRMVPFREFATGQDAPIADVDGRSVNAVIYTSGTTGPSKGVLVSNALAVNKALDFGRICDLTPADVLYSPLPLFHETGLLKAFVGSLASGGSVVVRDRFSTSEFWPDVRRHGVTVAVGFPTMQTWLAAAEPSPLDRKHTLTRLLSRPNPQFCERFGVYAVSSYGTTEITSAFHVTLGDGAPANSCGRVSRDWEARLVGDRGDDVPVGEVGEILLRPRAAGRLMSGYLNQPEATARATEDLWYRPGDLATCDAEGFYYFMGRKKDVIRRRGENISAWDVEQILHLHPAVDTAAALPVHREDGDDDLWVVVMPVAGVEIAAVELYEYCRAEMPDFMVPRYIEVRADIPRTAATARVVKHRLVADGPGAHCIDMGSPVRAAHDRVRP